MKLIMENWREYMLQIQKALDKRKEKLTSPASDQHDPGGDFDGAGATDSWEEEEEPIQLPLSKGELEFSNWLDKYLEEPELGPFSRQSMKHKIKKSLGLEPSKKPPGKSNIIKFPVDRSKK